VSVVGDVMRGAAMQCGESCKQKQAVFNQTGTIHTRRNIAYKRDCYSI